MAIDAVMQVLADIAIVLNVSIDLPHHVAKGPPAPGDANRGRGASSMKDTARLVYTMTMMSPEESKAMSVSEELRRHLRRVDSAKVNLAPMAEARWFKLVGVKLGNTSEIYPAGDEVQTVEPWAPPELFRDVDIQRINLVLDDIDKGLPDGNR
jgi:hypothetical protein